MERLIRLLPVITRKTWKPLCVTCKREIGYTAREGWYVGRVECSKCKP